MVLNNFGKIAHNEWIQSSIIRFEIELDEFVVMPNHFHAIVLIRGRGDRPVAPTMPVGPKPKSIGSLMAGYKSAVTKKINQLRDKSGEPVWQRNYFEYIIRDKNALMRIRKYIHDNPGNWNRDKFYI